MSSFASVNEGIAWYAGDIPNSLLCAKEPSVSAASLVHCVEATVAHTARVAKYVVEGEPPLRWVFQLRGASQHNAEWTCGRAVQSMPSLQTALL